MFTYANLQLLNRCVEEIRDVVFLRVEGRAYDDDDADDDEEDSEGSFAHPPADGTAVTVDAVDVDHEPPVVG